MALGHLSEYFDAGHRFCDHEPEYALPLLAAFVFDVVAAMVFLLIQVTSIQNINSPM